MQGSRLIAITAISAFGEGRCRFPPDTNVFTPIHGACKGNLADLYTIAIVVATALTFFEDVIMISSISRVHSPSFASIPPAYAYGLGSVSSGPVQPVHPVLPPPPVVSGRRLIWTGSRSMRAQLYGALLDVHDSEGSSAALATSDTPEAKRLRTPAISDYRQHPGLLRFERSGLLALRQSR